MNALLKVTIAAKMAHAKTMTVDFPALATKNTVGTGQLAQVSYTSCLVNLGKGITG